MHQITIFILLETGRYVLDGSVLINNQPLSLGRVGVRSALEPCERTSWREDGAGRTCLSVT